MILRVIAQYIDYLLITIPHGKPATSWFKGRIKLITPFDSLSTSSQGIAVLN